MPLSVFAPLIVPDTNVIVSGATLSQSPPSLLMDAWRSGVVGFALCEPILREVATVLTRPYFARRYQWSEEGIDNYLSDLREGSILVPATTPIHISLDPHDDMLFACAIEGLAQYIVSGDHKHVLSIPEYQGVKTISPSAFVEHVLPVASAA
jgi:uncharacterized protein